MAIQLQNPHSVIAVLETRPIDVLSVHLQSQQPSRAWEQVAKMAGQHRIPVQIDRHQASGRRRKNSGNENFGRGSGSHARIKEHAGLLLEQLFDDSTLNDSSSDKNDKNTPLENGLYLALDCLQDPHNIGAIFRAAAFFGVKGMVITKDRSAPLNNAVYDVASGGVDYVPFSLQTNLARALEVAKERGLWILGTSEHAETDFREIEADRSWLLVLGNEEKGMRRLTQEKCDIICKLTSKTPVTSLNVSVAAGVFISRLTGM